ncbi:unnamed protein product, partial [Phaeothamnion confervicola]
LEPWAQTGPDPPDALRRSDDAVDIVICYGLSAEDMTLHAYRALEALLHVYPSASVRMATVGPRYATVYKWANVVPPTQFQKYKKRGYDIEVRCQRFAELVAVAMRATPLLPGGRWWLRHKDDRLYGAGINL